VLRATRVQPAVHAEAEVGAEMPPAKAPPERRALTADGAQALLAAAKRDPLDAYVVVGLLTGLLPGELLGLQWDAVDLDAGTVAVRGSLKQEQGQVRLGDVKRGIRQSRRTIALPVRAVEALRAHRLAQRQQRLRVWTDMDLVFPSEVGTPMHRSNLQHRVDRITERAGLGHLSLTEIGRHSAASLMADDGVSLEEIADQFGHASTRMLERHYRHRLQPSIDAGWPRWTSCSAGGRQNSGSLRIGTGARNWPLMPRFQARRCITIFTHRAPTCSGVPRRAPPAPTAPRGR
jgi:integrase